MSRRKLEVFPYRTIDLSAVRAEYLSPSELAAWPRNAKEPPTLSAWGERSTLDVCVRLTAQEFPPNLSATHRLRAVLIADCPTSNYRGATQPKSFVAEQMSEGVELKLSLSGADVENQVDLSTLILSDEPGADRLSPKHPGSLLWQKKVTVHLGTNWGFPCQAVEITLGEDRNLPWFLDIIPNHLSLTLHSGPVLFVNVAHPLGKRLLNAEPNLVKIAAADIWRGMLATLVHSRASDSVQGVEPAGDEEWAEQDGNPALPERPYDGAPEDSLGCQIESWLLDRSGCRSVDDFVESLKNKPTELDRLVTREFISGID